MSKTASGYESSNEIDVSDVQFTVSTSCMLNAHEFLADSDIVKWYWEQCWESVVTVRPHDTGPGPISAARSCSDLI